MRKLIPFFTVVFLTFSPALWAQAIPQSRQQITLSYAPLVKQVTPAVVNIYTKKLVQQRVSPLFADPFFQQFFGGGMPQGFTRQRLENSLGSGVIVRGDGLIVTSNHVIAGADEIRVVLADKREYDATILITDEHSDLAVLRVATKGENLPALELRDSDDAEVGDLVLAIGNPFGVGQTVTSGIISAVAHTAVGSSDLDYFIQTDAAINPGNSGGALVTMDGKLVGINAAIYSRSGGNLGIGFAVPSNMVRVILGAAEQGKKNITRPWLGIDGQEVTPDIAASLGMSHPQGYLVNSLHAASPAAQAGLRKGDVIVSVNGHAVDDPEAFRYRVGTLSLGGDVTFGIMRKGQVTDIRVKLIAPPESTPRDKTTLSGNHPFAGATVENISPAVIAEMGLRGIDAGVIVSAVAEDAVAAGFGLQVGDIVLAVNGNKITTVEQLRTAVKKPARLWRVTLLRNGSTVTMTVN